MKSMILLLLLAATPAAACVEYGQFGAAYPCNDYEGEYRYQQWSEQQFWQSDMERALRGNRDGNGTWKLARRSIAEAVAILEIYDKQCQDLPPRLRARLAELRLDVQEPLLQSLIGQIERLRNAELEHNADARVQWCSDISYAIEELNR